MQRLGEVCSMSKLENKEEKKEELDSAQQGAVDIRINAVVSAGAGSGKTKVLSKRFTDLLLKDKTCKVEQILTLTFTKKATVEMTGRIYGELSKTCPDKAKDFYKANIKTLDSYCSMVARQGSRFYGISPDFTIDDELIKRKINSLALPFILKNRDNAAIKALVATKDFAEIASQLFVNTIFEASSVAEKIDFASTLEKQYKLVSEEWINTCEALEDKLSMVRNGLAAYEGNKSKYISAMEEVLATEHEEIPVIDFLNPDTEQKRKYIEFYKSVAQVSQKGTNSKSDCVKIPHNEIKVELEKLLALENYIYGSKIVKELVPLLEEFQQVVNETKRSTGILTYKDVSSLAIRILIDHPEIRNLEKEKYRYIMIDEFQDNNSMQRDLLFLLAEKKDRVEKSVPSVDELEKEKLFFVGDEKQSIYKFRGADVSVFRGLAKDFEEGNRELKTNYRSNPSLIAAFNSIFGGTKFPPEKNDDELSPCVFYTEKDAEEKAALNDEVPDYEAVYHNVEIPEFKLEELTKKNKKDFFRQRVHFAVYNSDEEAKPENFNPDQSECYWVVGKIKQLMAEKGYKPSQMAILFKTYSQLPVYEKTLLNEGIPYVTETVKGFFADGPVNDIMSLLRLQAYPCDNLSYANILRSPFVNLTDSEMKAVIALHTDQKNLFDINPENVLSQESLKRYNTCKAINDSLKIKVKTESLAEIISYLWYETGYRYETVWNQTVFMYASSYDRLFELARQADLDEVGLSEFVDSIDDYQSESEKLDGMEIPLESSEGVHMMSIHKSKGLEFPVVFVCGTGHPGKRDSNSSISYYSKEFGITINTPPSPLANGKSNFFYEMQKDLALDMTCAELRRVAYVALTRAEDEVYITGSYKFSNFEKNDFTPDGNKRAESILEVLLPSIIQFKAADEMPVAEGKPTPEGNTNTEGKTNTDGKTKADTKPTYRFDDKRQDECPFTFEVIPPKAKADTDSQFVKRSEIVSKLSEEYEKAEVIVKSEPESIYVSPSHLHSEDEETSSYKTSGINVDKKIPFYEIDELVKSSIPKTGFEPEFTYANFGTIAHANMECALKKEPPAVLNRELTGLRGDVKKLQKVEEICKAMQAAFLESETGKAAMASIDAGKFYRCEYSFKSLVNSKIVNGQIDLLFENADGSGYTIVDYKTNRQIDPKIYHGQLSCYRDAIAKMLGVEEKEIKCVLYYLRYGKAEDITADCNFSKIGL